MHPRILTIDDDGEARLAVQAVLERQQMHVTPAKNAEDGLRALSRAYFDLVITDFRMGHKKPVWIWCRRHVNTGSEYRSSC